MSSHSRALRRPIPGVGRRASGEVNFGSLGRYPSSPFDPGQLWGSLDQRSSPAARILPAVHRYPPPPPEGSGGVPRPVGRGVGRGCGVLAVPPRHCAQPCPPVRAVKCRPHLNFHWLLDAPRRCREQLLGPRFPAAPPKAPTRGAPHPTFTCRCGGRRRDSQTCSVTRCEALFCSDLRRQSIVRACFLF